MPLSDILAAALSRPAGRVVEGPVRNIVNEVLQDHGYASPAELQALRTQIHAVGGRVDALQTQVDALEAALGRVGGQVDALTAELYAAQQATVSATARATTADAHAVGLESRLRALESTSRPVAPSVAAAALDPLAHLDRQQRHLFRAGRLPGHVGPEGLIEIDGKAYRLDESLAGRPFEVVPGRKLQVLVDGGKRVPHAL